MFSQHVVAKYANIRDLGFSLDVWWQLVASACLFVTADAHPRTPSRHRWTAHESIALDEGCVSHRAPNQGAIKILNDSQSTSGAADAQFEAPCLRDGIAEQHLSTHLLSCSSYAALTRTRHPQRVPHNLLGENNV